MIGSNLPPLPYVEGLRRSLESGKVTAGRIEVANATPELQAKLDAGFRKSQRDLEQLIARYKTDPGRATLDTKSNPVERPDVQSLSKSDASPVPQDLLPLIETGRLEEQAINPTHGDLSITSTAVYQEWLLTRVGVDVTV